MARRIKNVENVSREDLRQVSFFVRDLLDRSEVSYSERNVQEGVEAFLNMAKNKSYGISIKINPIL